MMSLKINSSLVGADDNVIWEHMYSADVVNG